MDLVDLPVGEIFLMRVRICETLKQSDKRAAKQEYKKLLSVISHPAAIARGRWIRGVKKMQYLINSIIIWRRAS